MSANHWLHNVVTLWYHGGGHSVGASMVSVLQHLAQRWRWGRSVLLFAFLFFIGSAHFVNLYPLHTLFHNKHTHTLTHTGTHTHTHTQKKNMVAADCLLVVFTTKHNLSHNLHQIETSATTRAIRTKQWKQARQNMYKQGFKQKNRLA